MGFRLLLYDEDGSEIGRMNPVRTDLTSEADYRSPYEYRWELTHPDRGQWDWVEPLLRRSEDPHERGPSREVFETDEFTIRPQRMYRMDKEGPEEYLREVGRHVEQFGIPQTKVVEDR